MGISTADILWVRHHKTFSENNSVSLSADKMVAWDLGYHKRIRVKTFCSVFLVVLVLHCGFAENILWVLGIATIPTNYGHLSDYHHRVCLKHFVGLIRDTTKSCALKLLWVRFGTTKCSV